MATKFNYVCLNGDCSSKISKRREYVGLNGSTTVSVGSIKNFIVEKEADTLEHCPECDGKLKLIGTLGTFTFSKMSLMTPGQKKQMFKKRSHDHFKKRVEEKQRAMIHKFDTTGEQ